MIYHKLMLYGLLACIAILGGGCKEDTFGYPKTVTLPAEGGMVVVSGRNYVIFNSIYDDDGYNITPSQSEEEWIPDEYHIMRYKWLTAEHFQAQKKLVLTCEPNDSKKKRKLWIDASSGPDFFS